VVKESPLQPSNSHNITNEHLLSLAHQARKNAYAPYSHYLVGACILTDQGNTYTGVNVENRSYGATVCAERTAIGAMITAGEYKILKIAVDTGDGGFPCGICLQSIAEFAVSRELCTIIVQAADGMKELSLTDLAPHLWTSDKVQPKL
jgi:cytidine deaminase